MLHEYVSGHLLLIGHRYAAIGCALESQEHNFFLPLKRLRGRVLRVCHALQGFVSALYGIEQRHHIVLQGIRRRFRFVFAFIIFYCRPLESRLPRVPAYKTHAILSKTLMSKQPAKRTMQLYRGLDADGRRTPVLHEAALVLKGKALILGGNQPCGDLQIGLLFHFRQTLSRDIAQRRICAQRRHDLTAPATLYVLAHPQSVLFIGIFHAEAGDLRRILPFSRLPALVKLQLQARHAGKILVKRLLLQVIQKHAQTLRRMSCGAPCR